MARSTKIVGGNQDPVKVPSAPSNGGRVRLGSGQRRSYSNVVKSQDYNIQKFPRGLRTK